MQERSGREAEAVAKLRIFYLRASIRLHVLYLPPGQAPLCMTLLLAKLQSHKHSSFIPHNHDMGLRWLSLIFFPLCVGASNKFACDRRFLLQAVHTKKGSSFFTLSGCSLELFHNAGFQQQFDSLFVSASSSTRLQPKPAGTPSIAKVKDLVASLNHHSFQSLQNCSSLPWWFSYF